MLIAPRRARGRRRPPRFRRGTCGAENVHPTGPIYRTKPIQLGVYDEKFESGEGLSAVEDGGGMRGVFCNKG
jgi:hypothetical protein